MADAQSETSYSIAEQKRVLRKIREQIAKVDLPAPSADESDEVRDMREKKAKLVALVKEIERRIEVERIPLSKVPSQQAYAAYYSRIVKRVEVEATKSAQALASPPLRGRAVVVMTIDANGQLENVIAEDATSAEFGNYAVAVIKQLAPFEPFDIEMRKAADRLVIRAPFMYGPR